MNLLLIGTNHRIAPVSVRERLADAPTTARQWLDAAVRESSSIAELMVVATCHRVELYAATNDLVNAEPALLRFGSTAGRELFAEGTPRYVHAGEDAIRHLCRVACGLDSVIVGEAEISGQVRRAASLAREMGTLGPYIERVVAAALRSSGRARAETSIGRGVLSAASAAVTLVAEALGSLSSRDVLVVGAGQTGRQVLSRLAKLDMGRRLVASRSDTHAREAASESDAQVVPFDGIASAVQEVDVVFTTLQAPAFVLRATDLANRNGRPLFAVDLSVPRAIDPASGEVDGVTLRTVDDLGDIARASLARRVAQIPHVEAIARDEARRAFVQFRARARRHSSA